MILKIPFFQLLWYQNRRFVSLFTTPCRIFLKLIPSTFRLTKQIRHALQAGNTRRQLRLVTTTFNSVTLSAPELLKTWREHKCADSSISLSGNFKRTIVKQLTVNCEQFLEKPPECPSRELHSFERRLGKLFSLFGSVFPV